MEFRFESRNLEIRIYKIIFIRQLNLCWESSLLGNLIHVSGKMDLENLERV